MKSSRRFLVNLLCVVALIASIGPFAGVVLALSSDVVISQIYGGGGNSGATYTHDFIELFNRGATPVSLSGWSVQYASATGAGNFGSATNLITPLPNVTLAPGQYLLVQEAPGSGGTTPLPSPDVTDLTPIAMSATGGKVALVTSATGLGCNGSSTPCSPAQLALIKDLVGWDGANFYETAPAPTTANATALSRASTGCRETDNNSADFAVGAPVPRNSVSPYHVCPPEAAPEVLSSYPANGASGIPLNANMTVTFSEPVNVTGAWYSLVCSISGAKSATPSGGPTTFAIDPDADLVGGESCTLTIIATNVSDQDLDDPPDTMAANFVAKFAAFEVCGDPFTPIYTVQGSGPTSPLVDTEVAVEGIVVGDFQNNAQPDDGNLNGFHIQDPDGDGAAATSDGVFIYGPSAMDVSVGDRVRVRGMVSEYFGMTEVTVSKLWLCSSGNGVAPTALSLPVVSLDDFEPYEGMLVTFPQTLYISEFFNFDRYGEVVVSTARQNQPTAVYEPGSPKAAQLARENLLSRITIDDGRTTQNPDPALHPNGDVFDMSNLFRGGDTLTNITGVLDYSFDLYRIQPTQGADYAPVNSRTAAPDDVGGSLKVASYNLLNYFTTIDTGAFICGPLENQECRGADTPEEFTRQRTKIIAALAAMNADVVGLVEMENYPGDVPTADLVAGLNNVLSAGSYAYVATGAIGADAIRVALIYKPATVTPLGTYAILDSAVDPRFLDTYNRPVLAQAFQDNATGGIFTVAVNHLKSKGSDCNAVGDPDLGDGAGNCNLTRMHAAEALVDWLANDPTGSGDADALIIGDLNSYDKEDPIDALRAGGYTDMVGHFQGEYAYTYLFDGQLGYLDQAASADLFDEVTGVTTWHINADEPDLIDYDMAFKLPAQDLLYAPDPYRASDHDPVIVGLSVCDEIAPTLAVTVSPYVLWPANHKYVTVVATVQAVDNFDPSPRVTLVSVTSNEPDNGLGDGDTPNDIVRVDDYTFKLRAERSGTGKGRIYTLTYQVTDACRNSTLASATVTVPHNKGK